MMKTRLRRTLLAIAFGAGSALLGAGAQAQTQQPGVARLKQVTGNVLVSREAGLAAGSQEQRVGNGVRIITTANSEAIVEFDNGCEVRVRENQRFEVDSEKPCALLVAQALGPVPVAALGPGLLPTLLVPGGAAALLLGDRDRPAVSPN
jgi:hypothetical protein